MLCVLFPKNIPTNYVCVLTQRRMEIDDISTQSCCIETIMCMGHNWRGLNVHGLKQCASWGDIYSIARKENMTEETFTQQIHRQHEHTFNGTVRKYTECVDERNIDGWRKHTHTYNEKIFHGRGGGRDEALTCDGKYKAGKTRSIEL